MTKIVKSLSDKTTQEIESGGTRSYISFERLKEYLAIAVGIKPNETVEGIIVNEHGIDVKIGLKEENEE